MNRYWTILRESLCRNPITMKKLIVIGALLTILLVIIIFVCVDFSSSPDDNDWPQCSISHDLVKEIRSYQPIVDQIVAAAVTGSFAGNTYKGLAEFTDKFGSRMTGSKRLENSIDYLVKQLEAIGLDNVHTQNVTVPYWERGIERARLLSPRNETIKLIGLGGSTATPNGGITANVIAVETFDEFDQIPAEKVKGNIVLFVPKWNGYGKTVKYRNSGPSIASRKGAVAVLVRSITPFSMGTLHTGWQEYEKDVEKIPAAAITVEDAEALLRLYRRGENITIYLEMQNQIHEPAISRNTFAELKGDLEKPVVVVSGHIDSWDIGVGAMDDGGGSFISWKSLELLKKLNLKKPKRTIRAALWTAEEQCLCGAVQYQNKYKASEEDEFNFFIESDMGTFQPRGMDFSGNAEAECIFKEVLKLMKPLNATEFDSPTNSGPDIEVWSKRGFPSATLMANRGKMDPKNDDYYFWFHHSDGDSMLVENSDDLDKNTALFAAVAYVIADLSIDMPKTVTKLL